MNFCWKNSSKKLFFFGFVFPVLLVLTSCSPSASNRSADSSPGQADTRTTRKKRLDQPVVRQLKLDNTATDDARLAEICEQHPDLVELTLGGTTITDAGLEALTKLKNLKKLRLSNTSVTDKGMWILAKCDRIEDLDLSRTAIGDFGVRELTALSRLRRLNLYMTKLTDSGLDAFRKGDHRSASKIVWLNIDKCSITDRGISKLADLERLEWLHLGWADLTDEGLKDLAKLVTLKEVSITNTKVGHAGVESLKAALPDCKVNSNVGERPESVVPATGKEADKEARDVGP